MSDALAAALLASQRGQQQFDPSANSRRFAQQLMQQGASTAPVQHPIEGLSRALQGGLGGLMEGLEERDREKKNKRLIEGLTGAMSEKDPAKRMDILKGIGDDTSGVLAPFLGSILSQQIADERKYGILDRNLDAAGVPKAATPTTGAPGLGGGQQGPLTIDMTPLPNGAVAPGGFNNNVGNIRSGATPWEGKGAPQNGFETFSTPQQGANAAFKNLQYYVKQNPNMTVAEAITAWAPPKENNTQQYISQVAEGTGINPGMPLGEVLKDPAVAAQLLDAITRKEKGGLPQGVTADTFMAATGGQPPAGQPQVAQGGGFTPTNVPAQSVPGGLPQMPVQQPQVAQAPPPQQAPVTTMPEISPAAQALQQQALQARNGGDRERALALMQKAQEAQAAYVQERAKTQDTRANEAAEWNRKNQIEQQQKPPSEYQAKSATYADRMVQHSPILDALESQGSSAKGRALTGTVMGVGIPGANYAQSPEFRQFNAAKENWIAANLRAESGAVIGTKEYEDADKQYFPQPGDDAQTVADKKKLRKTATEGMVRSAGDKYKAPTPERATASPEANASPKAGGVSEGATATNPQTGEKIIFRNGQWGPQ